MYKYICVYTVSSIGDSMLLIYCGDVEEYLAEVVLVLEDGRWLEGGGDEGVWEGKRGNVLMELINAASSFIPVGVQYMKKSSTCTNYTKIVDYAANTCAG